MLFNNEVILFDHAPVLQVFYQGEQTLEIVDFSKYNPKTNTGYVLFQYEESSPTSTCIERFDDCKIVAAKENDRFFFYFIDNSVELFPLDLTEEEIDDYENEEEFDF